MTRKTFPKCPRTNSFAEINGVSSCGNICARKKCRLFHRIDPVTFFYDADGAILPVGKFGYADRAVEQAASGELSGMIKQIGMPLEVGDPGMIGKDAAFLCHQDAAVFPGTGGACGGRICEVLIAAYTI